MSNAGIWNGQNKVRPGAYINFKAVKNANTSATDRGVVAIPLALGWGPADQVVEIKATEVADGTLTKKLGVTIEDAAVKPLVEAMKYASKALVYPLQAGGIKADATIGELTATAKYAGTVGNDITIVVKEADASFYEVSTLLGTSVKDKQRVKAITDLVDNDFVTFSGTGTLEASAGTPLEGGTDSEITSTTYSNFLSAIKDKTWNTVAIPLNNVDGGTLNPTIVSYINGLRDAGRKVQAVVNNYPQADSEGIISVDQGYRTESEDIDVDAFVGTVAGMTAGAAVNQSNTYRVITGATEIINPKTDEEIELGLQTGCFILSYRQDGQVVVESDINTLVNVDQDKNDSFKKNRVIRTLDNVATSVRTTFENNFIGKVARNETGKTALKASLLKYFDELQNMEAIQNFTSEDLEVLDGDAIDAVVVNVAIQPLDSMEKLYMTVTVN